MSKTTLTVDLDAQTKQSFDELCEQFGISSDKLLNLFVSTVVLNRRIPAEIEAREQSTSRMRELFEQARAAIDPNEPEMTLEEINEEIRLARAELKARLAKEK